MAMVDLAHLYKVTAKGRTYWYAWRGGPAIRAPHGTPAFAAEYAAHHEARKGGDAAKLSGLIVDWKKSDVWAALADSTKKNWKGPLGTIQAQFGAVPLGAFEDQIASRKRIKAWLKGWDDRPRTRDMHKQV